MGARAILAVFALFAAAGCVSVVPSTRVERTVRLAWAGDITPTSVDGILSSLAQARESGETVVDFAITSPGGDVESAMRLGRALKEVGAPITVNGLCVSACAQFVLPAARSIRIKPGSVVAIHSSPLGWIRTRGRFLADEERAKALALAVGVDAYLRDLGADPGMLYCAERALAPNVAVSPDGGVRTYTASKSFAIVDGEFLRRYTRRKVEDASGSDSAGLAQQREALAGAIMLPRRHVCPADIRREDEGLLKGKAAGRSPDVVLRVDPAIPRPSAAH